MKPWLEDLSEEWIPQPTPPSLSQNPQTSQSVPPKPKSRLPRLRNSSGSFSEIQVRPLAKDLRPAPKKSALGERSHSDNNVIQAASQDVPTRAESRCASRSITDSPGGSVVYHGTVEQRPAKAAVEGTQQSHHTPEWRRRLLKGEVGYGEQRDLFSPMGLENIFQKPASQPAEAIPQPKSRLGFVKGLHAMPSSPPPWPSAGQEQGSPRDEHGADYTDLLSETRKDLEIGQNQDSVLREDFEEPRDAESFSMLLPGGNDNQQVPRTVSGQIEYENENFSPVYLSTNLKLGPGAEPPVANFRSSDLAQRLRHLGSAPASSDSNLASERNHVEAGQEGSSESRFQDESLPDDLPAGTPVYAAVGGFVELRRGGYSRDGSFRRRPLSPSPRSKAVVRNKDEGLGNSGTGAHAEAPSIVETAAVDDAFDSDDMLPSNPVTPHRNGHATHLGPTRTKSGSPLKLFDAHDTFTSNRLQRRLSQLEYKSEKAVSSSTQITQTVTTKEAKKASRLTLVEEASFQRVSPATEATSSRNDRHVESFRMGSFGQGQLDAYRFSEEYSASFSPRLDDSENIPSDSPTSDVAPPGSRQPFRFQLHGSSPPPVSSKGKRQGLTRVSNSFRLRNQFNPLSSRKASTAAQPPEPYPTQEYAEGKRGPTSPFKNPTPKRRRTLHSVEDGDDEDDVFSENGLKSVKNTHAAMQSVIGRKRKDARHDPSTNVADPEILARRHILRPRNPTPSQRRRDEIEAEILEATEAFILSSPKLNTIREHLDSPVGSRGSVENSKAVAVASEVAAFSLKRTQAVKDESRKRSVTTQDFLDEAVKIMEYIRTKGRPTSGLGSLEETESESPIKEDQNSNPLPSTPLTFSRPPSREGRFSEWREPYKQEANPNVMSHLQKYQDNDSDDFMGSSVRSWRFSRVKGPVSPGDESIVVEQNNIRITHNQGQSTRDNANDDRGIDSQPRTNGTHPSTSSSMGQTVVTNTSRRSEHVATLAPEAVAHLIPKQIAGMSFDHEKNMWIKQKSPAKETRPADDINSANESEEDPFGNIPDLSIDDTAEFQSNKVSPFKPTAETFLEESDFSHNNEERPVTQDGKDIPLADTSSAPSKVSNFAWSFPKTETRATSWSDQGTRNGGTQKVRQLPTTYCIPESDENDVEHEIKYFEGRGTVEQNMTRANVRDITISISRPHSLRSNEFEEPASNQVEAQHGSSCSPQKSGQQCWSFSKNRQSSRTTRAGWYQVAGAKTLPNTRVPQIGEHDEPSLMDDLPSRNYRMQLSMSVSAPVLGVGQHGALVPAESSPARAGDITFMLSDLPEFTLNQIDERELPNRVVVKHDGTKFSKALEDRYAIGTADLVKALQDVEPDEPYWEDLRAVDLHEKGLTNLNRLDEFCFRLEELDVSSNEISQVNGIPFTMRRLKIQDNCLTGLTSWASLMNLQYLDISGNDIDRLDGLNQLFHLRTLKVDNNKIKSLYGIMHLDGLIELSAVGNQLKSVDFTKSDLKSLTDLNMSRNCLSEVRNIHQLPRLQHLDLDDNCIDEFPVLDLPTRRCNTLKSLRVCRNRMASLIVDTYCPNLESLYVDGNGLTHISGLEHLAFLRTFSAREQTLESNSDYETCVGNLVRNAEVHNLYLSLNPTRILDISQHLLNLQRLELVSMGLKELPDNFGQLTPNIRSVNLNFNSLKDLRPLLNVKKLNELFVAGNKIARLRTNLAVLGKLTTMTKLDMRDNPLTLRFYAPTVENRVMSLRHKPVMDDKPERFVLPDGDSEADRQYLSRLDDETRLRRRVHEMMLATSCTNLRELDGLGFDKARILVKDDIWERLLLLGVIRKSEKADGDHD
ncbi:hypothetical protein BCR34DRAFT_604182 [Clohesyomyces aquaticus]|uniref:Septation initiation network scaffold protein cdc11 n=1 Tax=Clohesyomyces aquaticus TaxID=1231657 RepID=A0A1Y1Z8H2_9PLEO|nr:hypothetical protein BCR34DRAFT_604182 [Clohesyomyces aquaticus]